MHFHALATDFDGTITSSSGVAPSTLESLTDLKRSGRKLILLTGRILADLMRVFPQLDVFDLVVAENGALLFDPASREQTLLAEPLPPVFLEVLKCSSDIPLEIGHIIVASRQPHEGLLLKAIRDLGLDLQVIFNKGAVMVLPGNVDKLSGLSHALTKLGLSAQNVVGIGDAENDLVFLEACGCGVAVGNALPSVKEKADLVVAQSASGVAELVRLMIDDDVRLRTFCRSFDAAAPDVLARR